MRLIVLILEECLVKQKYFVGRPLLSDIYYLFTIWSCTVDSKMFSFSSVNRDYKGIYFVGCYGNKLTLVKCLQECLAYIYTILLENDQYTFASICPKLCKLNILNGSNLFKIYYLGNFIIDTVFVIYMCTIKNPKM